MRVGLVPTWKPLDEDGPSHGTPARKSTHHPTILGYIGEPVIEDDRWTNKIGGEPLWPGLAPPESYYRCGQCGKVMNLVGQLYAPLPLLAGLDRVLYIFACNSPPCNGEKVSSGPAVCWRVLRCQVPPSDREKEDTPVLPEVTPAGEAAIDHRAAEPSADWGGGEDWGDNTDWLKQTDDTDLEKLIESSLTLADEEEEQEKISTNSTSTNSQPAKNEKEKHSGPYQCGPHSFCGFYMEVEEERMRPIVSKKEKKLAAYWIKELKSADEDDSYEDRPGNKQRKGKQMKGSKKNSGGVTEVYEETEEKHLLKFQEYLERNPEHVFRYHFAGRPLWLTREIPQSIPHCERCGAERVFECEVMPTLIYLLQSAQSFGSKEKDEAGVHLEFGCVVIFSCSQSCGQEGEYSYEFAYLQQAL